MTVYKWQKGRPQGVNPILKLCGRWGGYGNPKKLKAIARRMIRRVAKLALRKEE